MLHHREVTIICCPVQWCPVTCVPRIQIHLRSLHHSLHNLQLSSLAGLKKATTVVKLLGLVTATLEICQVQLPAPRIGVSHEERPA